ncbi:MAG: hypothetical protein U5R31_10260 [Acidimicrobiia bacterium]|nr:hypothetical protein [Acidimicrobiia bacterium]
MPWSTSGLPEAQLNLAHAVVRLATAPKSNRVTVALGRARDAVEAGGAGEVPGASPRDAHYRQAASLGHGEGYVYPHDDPEGWVDQSYRPIPVSPTRSSTSRPTHGDEAAVRDRLRRRPRGPDRRTGRERGRRGDGRRLGRRGSWPPSPSACGDGVGSSSPPGHSGGRPLRSATRSTASVAELHEALRRADEDLERLPTTSWARSRR